MGLSMRLIRHLAIGLIVTVGAAVTYDANGQNFNRRDSVPRAGSQGAPSNESAPRAGPQGAGGDGSARDESQRGRGAAENRLHIQPSGLSPSFAREASCPPIASPFASDRRYDGSRRPPDQYGGLHGGMDISLPEGTKLLAVAGGTVVHSGEGGQAEGIFIWLQHSPDNTGLPFWIYTKYQHLQQPPDLKPGQRVRPGQVVGLSGKTGTEDIYFGPKGYPHLHLTAIASSAARHAIRGTTVIAPDMRLFDPVAVYIAGLRDPEEVHALPAARKSVTIPYATEDGTLYPAATRFVWPLACKRL